MNEKGRPRIPRREKRSVFTFVGLTPDERATVEELAAKDGRSLSSWLRQAVREKLEERRTA